MMFEYSYRKIAQAIDYYKSIGYVWIDTPWIVDSSTTAFTSPSTLERCHLGDLVGSAEQGFIQLLKEGKLQPDTRYVSAGPCFRFGDKGQPLKHPYFFKVELCSVAKNYSDVPYYSYFCLMGDAQHFLGGAVTRTEIGCDLEINGIEVGSYGLRRLPGLPTIAYGTGLAEPRHSQALLAVR